MTGRRAACIAVAWLIATVAAGAARAADDPFQSGVRPTEPLSPEQQRAAFHLPPGFEIQLFAAEPDLRKPLNMQWDATGRPAGVFDEHEAGALKSDPLHPPPLSPCGRGAGGEG